MKNILGKNLVNLEKGDNDFIYINNKKYFDLSLQNGVLLLGHNSKIFKNTLNKIIKNKISLSNLNISKIHKKISNIIKKNFRSTHKLIYCTTGSESVIKAIRIAKALSKNKKKIFLANGSWHGSVDQTLFFSKNNLKPIPISSGISENFIKNVKILPFDDVKKSKKILDKFYKEAACIIIEPIPASLPTDTRKNYLKYLREFSNKKNIPLIYDEIITGIRTKKGSVQNKFNIFPDITIIGKSIGGGLPISFILINKKISKKIKLLNKKIFFGGTFSSNNYSVLSCFDTLSFIDNNKKIISKIILNAAYFQKRINHFCKQNNLDVQVYRFDSIIRIIFTKKNIGNVAARDFLETKKRNRINNFRKFLFQKSILYPKNGVIFFSAMINQKKIDFLVKNICEGLNKYFKK